MKTRLNQIVNSPNKFQLKSLPPKGKKSKFDMISASRALLSLEKQNTSVSKPKRLN